MSTSVQERKSADTAAAAASVAVWRAPWFMGFSRAQGYAFLIMLALIVVGPFVLYPVFLMRVLCAALFACAFNLMLGFVGLLSFGHAAFFGMGSYVTAWTMKNWHLDAIFAIQSASNPAPIPKVPATSVARFA